ncbi:hypothetical protein ACFYYR_13415 [Streptomyces sp. NPDC001922]|uniref:hypothetical protein n=1 Tax=Streptomyces sp. NPDC001922 TaxID=3364624 RepID=UPI0036934FA0
MADRRLAALGFAEVPAERPLSYPGRPVTGPYLLTGAELLPLAVRRRRPGAWPVTGTGGPGRPLDDVLAALGRPGTGRRHPVIAVGSNASPAQLVHKLTGRGVSAVVPLVPVRVTGVAVGCSGHVSRPGYVARAPYPSGTAVAADAAAVAVLSWLDPEQLAAVDASEAANYRRVTLPGDRFAMTLPSGERPAAAGLYVSRHGVLAGPDGGPRPGTEDQAALLTALLAASPRLTALLGPDALSWVRRAGADPELRRRATRLFAEEGLLLPPADFGPYPARSAGLPLHDDLPLYDDLPPLDEPLPG